MSTTFVVLTFLSGFAALVFLAGTAAAQDAAQPPAQDCAATASRLRAMRIMPALQQGYGIQYWGEGYDARTLAAAPHGLLILEVAKLGAPDSDTGHELFFTPEEIALINRGGARPVLGYLNIAEIETYRDYWADFTAQGGGEAGAMPPWYGPLVEPQGHLAVFWTQEWKDIVLARVDQLMATGLDGLFLDDVLHYYSFAHGEGLQWPGTPPSGGPADAPEFALAMMELVELVAMRARSWNCDALVVVNNGAFIGRDAAETTPGPDGATRFSRYLQTIDGIMVEGVFAPGTHPHTLQALSEDFQANGVSVLSLDVAAQFPDLDFDGMSRLIAGKARSTGIFVHAAADNGYNRLFPPITLLPELREAAK